MYGENEQTMVNPVSGPGTLDTPVVAGILVIGSLFALVAIRAGFRGVNLAGVRVGVS